MIPSPTEDQVRHFQKFGYLVVERLLAAEEVKVLGRRMSQIAAGQCPDFPVCDIEYEPSALDSASADLDAVTSASAGPVARAERPKAVRKLNRCAENDAVFFAHAKHPRILDIVESLIGPDIKLFGSQCFMKPPGGVEKPFHQDSAYFPIEPMELVTCWTAIDDVTVENGCLRVIPESHRRGLVAHSQSWYVGDRRDMQVPDESLDANSAVLLPLSAGSCSFHHSLLLHGSGLNATDRPRRGLAIHYMSSRSVWTHSTQAQPAYLLVRGRAYPGCV